MESVLRGDFYKDFCEVKDQLKLDTSMYGFFDKCVLVNEFLTRKNLFLKFYERRDKYRYLIKKMREAGRIRLPETCPLP